MYVYIASKYYIQLDRLYTDVGPKLPSAHLGKQVSEYMNSKGQQPTMSNVFSENQMYTTLVIFYHQRTVTFILKPKEPTI